MLVLTRKANQALRIGDSVVRIIRIAGGSVRLGIDAPDDVNIVREELEDGPPPPRKPLRKDDEFE